MQYKIVYTTGTLYKILIHQTTTATVTPTLPQLNQYMYSIATVNALHISTAAAILTRPVYLLHGTLFRRFFIANLAICTVHTTRGTIYGRIPIMFVCLLVGQKKCTVD